jgi:ethanolamine utilization protein EutP (predicted NTPase)
MAEAGTHHLAVAGADGQITSMVSQSSVIKWLYMRTREIGLDTKGVKVSQLRPYSFLTTISQDAKALAAFSIMDSRNTSMGAGAFLTMAEGNSQ